MKKKKERKIEPEPKEFISPTSSDVIRYRLRYFIVPTVITLFEEERIY